MSTRYWRISKTIEFNVAPGRTNRVDLRFVSRALEAQKVADFALIEQLGARLQEEFDRQLLSTGTKVLEALTAEALAQWVYEILHDEWATPMFDSVCVHDSPTATCEYPVART